MEPNQSPESLELAKFPSPHVAVDVALISVAPDPRGRLRLVILAHKRQDGLAKGEWALVGRMVRERERLLEAVRIALRKKCGIEGLSVRQLFVSDEPTRDSRGWVMSVAFMATQRWSVLQGKIESDSNLDLIIVEGSKKYTLPENQRKLPFEHDVILDQAILSLRARYESRPDPDLFLGKEFTVLQLREIHEAVLGRSLDKDLFRRKMQRHLKATGELLEGSVGKPAELFTRQLRGSRADVSS